MFRPSFLCAYSAEVGTWVILCKFVTGAESLEMYIPYLLSFAVGCALLVFRMEAATDGRMTSTVSVDFFCHGRFHVVCVRAGRGGEVHSCMAKLYSFPSYIHNNAAFLIFCSVFPE